MELSSLTEMHSCFLVELSRTDVSRIRNEPFHLACGEVLDVGDCFTEIGSSGSAGNLPVSLTAPWVQRYRGLLKIHKDSFESVPGRWAGRDLVLFDAFDSSSDEGFLSPGYRARWAGTRDVSQGYYIAYLRHCDDMLFHTRGGASSSVCKCTSLARWPLQQ